jgi:hypothetical protein
MGASTWRHGLEATGVSLRRSVHFVLAGAPATDAWDKGLAKDWGG